MDNKVSKTVTVTNTVNGKELPIYFVEMDEKTVDLSHTYIYNCFKLFFERRIKNESSNFRFG